MGLAGRFKSPDSFGGIVMRLVKFVLVLGIAFATQLALAENVEVYNQPNVVLNLTGSESRNVQVNNATTVKIRFHGSSDLTIQGNATSVEISGYGSADVDARDLQAGSVDISAGGSSTIRASASSTFDIDATGSATIYLYGTGTIASQNVTGSARVIRR